MAYTPDITVTSDPILPEVTIFSRPPVFKDLRGTYDQIFDVEKHMTGGHWTNWVQDCVAMSRKGVLRGLHGDATTWKLVTCLQGSFQLVLVDNRPTSPTYLKHTSYILSGESIDGPASDVRPTQILIPPGFGNGHLALTDTIIFHYKQSTAYDRNSQFTLKWDDPKLNIPWMMKDVILSERDATAPLL